MWNSNYLTKLAEKAQLAAEKAQRAAANVEAQLNDSVGAAHVSTSSSAHGGNALSAASLHEVEDDIMDDDDDFFGDDSGVRDRGMERGFDDMNVNGTKQLDAKTVDDADEKQLTPPPPNNNTNNDDDATQGKDLTEPVKSDVNDNDDGWNDDEVGDMLDIDMDEGEDEDEIMIHQENVNGGTCSAAFEIGQETHDAVHDADSSPISLDETASCTNRTTELPLQVEENHHHEQNQASIMLSSASVAAKESSSSATLKEQQHRSVDACEETYQDLVIPADDTILQAIGKSNHTEDDNDNSGGRIISSLESMGFERGKIDNALRNCENHNDDLQISTAFMLENNNINESSESPSLTAVPAEGIQMTAVSGSSLHEIREKLESEKVGEISMPSTDGFSPDSVDQVSVESFSEEAGNACNMTPEVLSDENKPLVEEPSTINVEDAIKEHNENMDSNEGESNLDNEAPAGFVPNQSGEVATQLLSGDQNDRADLQNSIELSEKILEQSIEIENLRNQVSVREDQLRDKSLEMAKLNDQHETELDGLKLKVTETKAEARRRIMKSKERVEDIQKRLVAATSTAQDDEDKDAIIEELRNEGAALAQQQSTFEQSIRSARKDVRDLSDSLEDEKEKNGLLDGKVKALTDELRETSKRLDVAKEGEKRALKLEEDLDKKSEELVSNVLLQRSLKEKFDQLRVELAISKEETEKAKQGLISKGEQESERLKKEKDDIYKDLEAKLRLSEKEANFREDALRHEVSELRKRWQDAVRRADGKDFTGI